MYTLTTIRTCGGDFQVHRGGCLDIKRSHRGDEQPISFSGETILDAIKASDVDSFGWFGQTPYAPDPDDRPWAIGHGFTWAPCFAEDVASAGIGFNPETFEPSVAGQVVVEPSGAKRRTIKVLVQLTVEVDLDEYRINYGADDAATIRRDVKAAIADSVATGAVLADGIVDVKQW